MAKTTKRGGQGGQPTPPSRQKRPQRPAPPERPKPPWHPVPLAELLIVAGLIAVAVGVATGPPSHSAVLLGLGAAAAVLGTVEVCLREHLAGYRSHALLLALVGVGLFHGAVALVLAAFGALSREANLAVLVADGILLYALLRALRTRYLLARERSRPSRRRA